MVYVVKHYCCDECCDSFDTMEEAIFHERKCIDKIEKEIKRLDKKLGVSKAKRRYA
jgi:hypothetical protein